MAKPPTSIFFSPKTSEQSEFTICKSVLVPFGCISDLIGVFRWASGSIGGGINCDWLEKGVLPVGIIDVGVFGVGILGVGILGVHEFTDGEKLDGDTFDANELFKYPVDKLAGDEKLVVDKLVVDDIFKRPVDIECPSGVDKFSHFGFGADIFGGVDTV